MTILHDHLWSLTVDVLKLRLKLLGEKPANPNKSGCIDAIKRRYDRRGLEELWSSLDDTGKLAVAEACHAVDGVFHRARFKAKHGVEAVFQNIPESERYGFRRYDSNPEYSTRLNLLLFPAPDRNYFVPSDLAALLREFVPVPPAPEVMTLEGPLEKDGWTVRLTEHDALVDIMAMLHLAEQGNFSVSEKTGMPSAAGAKRILECLSGGDFYPYDVSFPEKKWQGEQEIGFIKPVAWAMLLTNAKLVFSSGTKSKLTPAGTKALRKPAHEIIRDVWTKWISNTAHDEFKRVNDIKGQGSKNHMTAKPPRRQAILATLGDCPVGKWISAEALSDHIQATAREFLISHDPWRLYISDAEYGSLGYDGYGGWNILQFRYVLVFLFEYAATLGLIDVAFEHPEDARNDFCDQWGTENLKWLSRHDGLRAFRITPLGAWCLGLTHEFKASIPLSSLELSVTPGLSIEVVSGQPTAADRMMLEGWALPMGKNDWRLDPALAVSAVERGRGTLEFAMFLKNCGCRPLPEDVARFLETAERDGTALRRKGQALIFECRDEETAARICSLEPLRNRCFRIGVAGLVVPAEHEARFCKLVRESGLGIV